MGPLLPVPQFSLPQKRGACDAQSAKTASEKKLHNVTEWKQNFPMNLPLRFRFRPVMMTDQHRSARVRLSAFISLSASQTQVENLPSSSPLHQPLPDSLSRRSRRIYFPLVCVRAYIPQLRNMFVMQNCLCRSPGNNIWLVDKSLPRLLRVSSLQKSSISILPYRRMIYVTKQHSMNCNFYNQIYNLRYIFGCIF